MAGLLTGSCFNAFPDNQWQWFMLKLFAEHHSSGSVQDSHLIPFLIFLSLNKDRRTNSGANIEKIKIMHPQAAHFFKKKPVANNLF